MHADRHYRAIREFYGERRAERSGVALIAHIDEGLRVLDCIGASLPARRAFCLHPMLQGDVELAAALLPSGTLLSCDPDRDALMLAMEYRAVANAYLSRHFVDGEDCIALSPLKDVNDMLIADKVQNRKDFEIHHAATHHRSDVLAQYFANWLRALGVDEARYRRLAAEIGGAA